MHSELQLLYLETLRASLNAGPMKLAAFILFQRDSVNERYSEHKDFHRFNITDSKQKH